MLKKHIYSFMKENNITDIELWKASVKGSTEAFGELYTLYWEKLYTTVYWRVRDEDTAKDIVQEVFISIWEKKMNLSIQHTFEGYLMITARHKVFNFFRDQEIKQKHDMQAELLRLELSSTSSTFTETELDQIYELAIKELPARMREVYLLSRKSGLTVNQIALKLGLSPQTVKNQISGALKIIRRHLDKYL